VVFFLPIWIAIWAIVAFLVYLDAKKRGMNAFEWSLMVFFFFVIGLIAYVLVRSDKSKGRPMPVLVVMLVGSFVLMLLSGIIFMAGLSESLARAFFLATVIIWFALGIWTIVDGQQETRRIAAAQAMEKAKTKDEAKVEAKAEAKADAKADAKTETKVDAGANLDEDAPSPKSSPDAEDGLNDP
jgi:peptidoglycan/LPS O-acetylase OafA/YrhL